MSIQTLQFQKINKMHVLTDAVTSPGSTTTTATALAGDGALTVTAITNFSNGDVLRVGDGEDMTVYSVNGAPSGLSIPITPNLRRNYAIGTVVVEQIAEQFGPIRASGFKFSAQRNMVDEFVASQRLQYTVLRQIGRIEGEFEIAGFTMYTLALSLGIASANIQGAGTSTSPYNISTDGNLAGTLSNVAIIVEGNLSDAAPTPMRAEFFGCQFDYRQFKIQLARGVISSTPVKFLAGGSFVLDKSASPYSPSATKLVTNTDLLTGLTDFGYFTPFALSGTLNGSPVAGVNALTTAANPAGLVVGDFIQLDVGQAVEFHMVHSISGAGPYTINLKTNTLRGHLVGAAWTKVTLTTVGTLNGSGVTIDVAGTLADVTSGLKEVVSGLRAGNVTSSIMATLTSYDLTSFALMLGLPLPGAATFLSALTGMGDTVVTGWYVKGTMASTKVLWGTMWNVLADLSGAAAVFTNDANAPTLPIKGRATGGLSFFIL